MIHDNVGDCAIASSFVSYLGPFIREMREQLNNNLIGACQKLAIPHSKDLHLTQFLTSDQEVGEWTVQVLALCEKPSESMYGRNNGIPPRSSGWSEGNLRLRVSRGFHVPQCAVCCHYESMSLTR